MKCLLTGGTGLLGFDLLKRIPHRWNVVVTLNRNRTLLPLANRLKTVALNLTDRKLVQRTLASIRPDVVVHTASQGDIDYCQHHQEEAWEVNVAATQWLLEACRAFDPIFVFLSTIYVFDGRNPPYDENASPNPLDYYARTKCEAEDRVLELSRRPVILRPVTLYGWHLPGQRTNCVTWLLHKLSKGETVRIVADVVSNYLWVADAARAVLAAIQREAYGISLLGGPQRLSRYELSLKVADVFGFDRTMISPVTSDHFPDLAPRPKESTCKTDKIEKELGVAPLSPEHALMQMRSAIPEWEKEVQEWAELKTSRVRPLRMFKGLESVV